MRPLVIRNILVILFIAVLSISFWVIITSIFYKSLFLSFYADDWAVIWGVKQQHSIFFNPSNVNWYYHQSEYTSRIGNLQIWVTGILYKLHNLNVYQYHLVTLVFRTLVAITLFIISWRLTKNSMAAILGSVLFLTSYVGIESIWWYNVSSVYLFLVLVLISLYLHILSFQRFSQRLFILSLLLIAFSIYLYPPRSHVFLGFLFIGPIYSNRVLNKSIFLKAFITLAVILLSFKLLVGGQGTSVASELLGRLKGGVDYSLEKNRSLLTYFFDVVSISIFSQDVLTKIFVLPDILKIPFHKFYLWTVVIYPATALLIHQLLRTVLKGIPKKNASLYLFMSLSWIVLNLILKALFFTNQWDSFLHFCFITSGLLLILSLSLVYYFKNVPRYNSISKLLLTSFVLSLFGYLVNWFIDINQFPSFYDGSRYYTISSAFGSLFLALIITLTLMMVKDYLKNYSDKTRVLGITAFIIFLALFLRWQVLTNIENINYQTESLLQTRSTKIIGGALTLISDKSGINPTLPPKFVMIYTADGVEHITLIEHAYALWNEIDEYNQFPIIHFYESNLDKVFADYCSKYPGNNLQGYKYKIGKDKTIDLTQTEPILRCE